MAKITKKTAKSKKTGINEHKYIPNITTEEEHKYNIPEPDRTIPAVLVVIKDEINNKLKVKKSYLRLKLFKNYSYFNVAAYDVRTDKFVKMLNDKGDQTDTFNYLDKILTFISLI